MLLRAAGTDGRAHLVHAVVLLAHEDGRLGGVVLRLLARVQLLRLPQRLPVGH